MTKYIVLAVTLAGCLHRVDLPEPAPRQEYHSVYSENGIVPGSGGGSITLMGPGSTSSSPTWTGTATAASFTAANGGFTARNANSSLSIGSSGSEYFGIAAGSNNIFIGGQFWSSGGNIYTYSGTNTSGQLYSIAGTLAVVTTAVGNVGASGPDDLQTTPLSANSLTVTNRCVDIKVAGTVANNANAKTVRLTIGPTPTVLITKQLNVSLAGCTWKLEATVCRTGASTQDYFAEAWNSCGTTVSSTDGPTVLYQSAFGTLTQTESAAQVIKSQSTVSTADNDIVSELLKVSYQ